MIVTDFLVNHFESILDYNFTAKVEDSFDDIAEGKEDWREMMKDFYKGFHPQVEDVQENAERESGERILGEDPKTGRQVSVRLGNLDLWCKLVQWKMKKNQNLQVYLQINN